LSETVSGRKKKTGGTGVTDGSRPPIKKEEQRLEKNVFRTGSKEAGKTSMAASGAKIQLAVADFKVIISTSFD